MPPTTAPTSCRSAKSAPTSPPPVATRLDAPYTATRPNTTSTAASTASKRVSHWRSVTSPPRAAGTWPRAPPPPRGRGGGRRRANGRRPGAGARGRPARRARRGRRGRRVRHVRAAEQLGPPPQQQRRVAQLQQLRRPVVPAVGAAREREA